MLVDSTVIHKRNCKMEYKRLLPSIEAAFFAHRERPNLADFVHILYSFVHSFEGDNRV